MYSVEGLDFGGSHCNGIEWSSIRDVAGHDLPVSGHEAETPVQSVSLACGAVPTDDKVGCGEFRHITDGKH